MSGENLFGQVLQQLRARRKLSQKEAADVAEISEAYWGGIERGATSLESVSFETLWTIIGVVAVDHLERRRLLALAGGKHQRIADEIYAAAASAGGVPPLEAVIEATDELRTSEDKAALKRLARALIESANLMRPVEADDAGAEGAH